MKLTKNEKLIIGGIFLAKIFLHLIHPEYGYHRDELYYMAIANDFSWHNLEMTPLTPLYLKSMMFLFGNSIKALHFAASLCGAFAIAFAMLIAREFGGKLVAMFLTGLFVLFSGFIIFGAIFTYDSIDFLIWTITLYLLVRIINTNDQKRWLAAGLMMGLGMVNKLTILFLALTIFASLWLVPERRYFKEKWIWLAALLAVLFALPFVYWQQLHDWYFLAFAQNYSGGYAYLASFPEYLWAQILPNNIWNFPIWLTGVYLLLVKKEWKPYRFFGVSFVFLFFLLFFMGGKFYFLIPYFILPLAASGVAIERFLEKKNYGRNHLIGFSVVYLLLVIPLIPMFIPVLPVDSLVNYVKVFGIDAGVKTENRALTNLPQHFADRFGWEEMVKGIANAVHNKTGVDASQVGILTGNWGQASAVQRWKEKYRLSKPIMVHSWFYYEALREHEPKQAYVALGFPRGSLQSLFRDVTEVGLFTNPYCMPDENNTPIFVCKRPLIDLKQYLIISERMDEEFTEVLKSGGVDEAMNYARAVLTSDPDRILFTEQQMNSLAYNYLRKGAVEDAISLFILNTKVYSQSSNVYDSLAEGYMIAREYDKAITYYNKSLELNPNNDNAVIMLERIAEEQARQ